MECSLEPTVTTPGTVAEALDQGTQAGQTTGDPKQSLLLTSLPPAPTSFRIDRQSHKLAASWVLYIQIIESPSIQREFSSVDVR